MHRASLLITGLLLLAGCSNPQARGSSSAESGATGSSPIVVATPGVAEQMKTSEGPFPAVPAGYRGLGGVFSPEGRRVIVAADMEATKGDDLSIGLAHGMAILAHSEDDPGSVSKADCGGAGASPESAVKVANLAKRSDDVQAGIACARLMYPGSRVEAAQLIANETGYLSQLVLQTTDGRRIVVYTDVNGFAQQLISELH